MKSRALSKVSRVLRKAFSWKAGLSRVLSRVFMEGSGLCRVQSRVLSWKADYTKQSFQGSEQGSLMKSGH